MYDKYQYYMPEGQWMLSDLHYHQISVCYSVCTFMLAICRRVYCVLSNWVCTVYWATVCVLCTGQLNAVIQPRIICSFIPLPACCSNALLRLRNLQPKRLTHFVPGVSEKCVLFELLLWLWSKKSTWLDARGAKDGWKFFFFLLTRLYWPATEKRNVYLPSLRMKVPDHVYVFGTLLLQ
jgi:hypothetical protein